MKLPKIINLDLRDSEVQSEIDNYGMYWDWPQFPVDTLTFINTGVRPSASRKVTVHFTVNVKPSLSRTLRYINRQMQRAGSQAEVSHRGW